MSSTTPPFSSRKTIIAASGMLKALGHSGFDHFLMELGLPDPDVGRGSGLMARTTSLAKYAIENPDIRTAEGEPLGAAIVARAGELYRENISVNITDKERDAFQRASAGDGSMSDVTSPAWSNAMPNVNVFQNPAPAFQNAQEATIQSKNRKIFVVHGHDLAMRETVARFVAAIGLEPIILAEQTSGGRTVIEKFERNADVGFAIILLSPDDLCQQAGRPEQARARQNVILEWGYFIGRLGRAHVCALKKGPVELPSDVIGIVWENFDDNGGWKGRLAKELIEAGQDIDLAKVLSA
jgi:predicted nucleotide-binding protein